MSVIAFPLPFRHPHETPAPAPGVRPGIIIAFPRQARLLNQGDLNALRTFLLQTHGGWQCEWSLDELGTATIKPAVSTLRRYCEFTVSRDGSRLVLSVGAPLLPGRLIGRFPTREALLDALGAEIATRMARGGSAAYGALASVA